MRMPESPGDKQRRFTLDADDIADGITYDKLGRMNYHPEFHWNHGTRFTLEEKIYLAKFYEIDGARLIGLALGRTDKAVMGMASVMMRTGEFERLKVLSDEEWEKIMSGSERHENPRL